MCTPFEFGIPPFFSDQIDDPSFDFRRLARISAEHRSEFEFLAPWGSGKTELTRSAFHDCTDDTLPKVGDWVILDAAVTAARIIRMLDRRTALVRGSAGPETSRQVLAANVDIVFVVAGLDTPFNAPRVERYLSLIWSSGASPVLVLNKADLADDPAAVAVDAEAHCPGVPLISASSQTGQGLDDLRQRLNPGVTAAFVGPSGVGKSTLINALAGGEQMDTQAVRTGDQKGRHTTVHRQLLPLPGGGMVIDTPGLRELQLAGGDGIASAFPEIEALVDQCRFRDCGHESEPGCAVKLAVEEGRIRDDRYEHYIKLQHDARSFELRQDERLRRQTERTWGKLAREGDMIRRLKRGR